MRVKDILGNLEEGEFIPSKDIKGLIGDWVDENDPAVITWKDRVAKARKDIYYTQGAYLAAWMAGKTPAEIIKDVYEDIKTEGKPRRANEIAIDMAVFLERVGKTKTEPCAPRTAGARLAGFMSFISNVSGHELSKDVRKRYAKFKKVSNEHLIRYQLKSEDLFKIVDHCDVTEKSLILFLASTGVSRKDIPVMRVPHGFFKDIEKAKEQNYPAPKIAPMVHFYYSREKTGEYGYLWLAGDALKAWLDYARQKSIKEGEPFFIGHGRKGMTDDSVYNIVTKASQRAGIRITPKMLREYVSGCLKDEGVNPDIINLVTAHSTGDLGEAYTAKHRLAKAYMKIWKYLNPYLAREAKAIEAQRENKSLKEELTELRAEFREFKELVVTLLTAQNGVKAEAFNRIVAGV